MAPHQAPDSREPARAVQYEMLVAQDSWSVEFRPAAAGEEGSAEQTMQEVERQLDAGMWSLLALLPTG